MKVTTAERREIQACVRLDVGCCEVSISTIAQPAEIVVFDGYKELKTYGGTRADTVRKAIQYAERYSIQQFKAGRRKV